MVRPPFNFYIPFFRETSGKIYLTYSSKISLFFISSPRHSVRQCPSHYSRAKRFKVCINNKLLRFFFGGLLPFHKIPLVIYANLMTKSFCSARNFFLPKFGFCLIFKKQKLLNFRIDFSNYNPL